MSTLRMSDVPPDELEDILADLEEAASDYLTSMDKRNAAKENLEAHRRRLEEALQASYGEATGLQVSLNEPR